MRKHKLTDEEKVAMRISAIVSDLRLDIEQVGEYLAVIAPSVSYNRLITIAESAQHHKEEKYNEQYQYRLF
ncbi:MAG: hypothetical protein ACO36B_06895 [Methylophilaceae bacterium]